MDVLPDADGRGTCDECRGKGDVIGGKGGLAEGREREWMKE